MKQTNKGAQSVVPGQPSVEFVERRPPTEKVIREMEERLKKRIFEGRGEDQRNRKK